MTTPTVDPTGPAAWSQLPALPSRRHRAPTPAARTLVLVVLIGLPAACRSAALFGGWSAVGVVIGASIAAVAVSRTPSAWPPGAVRIAGIVIGALVAGLTGGRVSGAWMLLGAVGATGAAAAWSARPDRSVLHGLGPVLGATTGAAVVAALHPAAPVTHLLVLAAAGLAGASARWSDRLAAFDAGARRGAQRVGDALAIACFAVLAVPFVLLPWVIGRVVRWDATWSPTAPGSTWTASADSAGPSRRAWLPTPPVRTWPWRRRAARAAVRLALVIGLLAFAVQSVRSRSSQPPASLVHATAMADAAYWPDLIRAQDALRANMGLGSYVYEQPDVASRYLNIEGGHRVTWKPPAASACRPLEVWMFGGSTMFGEGQRDEHTVPSELARAAWEDGVALDVTNFGQLGDPHWVEARRLAEALGTSDDRPDLVLFYDGANEVITRISLNDEGRAGQQTFVSYLDSGLFDQLDRYLRPVYQFSTDSSALEIQRPATRRLEASQVADLAARQYRLALRDSRQLVDQEDLNAIWFNQPTTWTTMDEAEADRRGGADRFGKTVSNDYQRQLPDGVNDLSGLFRGVPDPIFYDTAHTNEQGARDVAAAMWDEARPVLTARCDEEATCC